MSDQNKEMARRFYEEVLNNKNFSAVDELIHPDVVDHAPMPGQPAGIEGIRATFHMFAEAFPDIRVVIDDMISEGDLVAVRLSGSGTHQGAFMGAAPTGKTVTFKGIDMIRIKDGKASDIWHYGDEMMAFAEIGVQPPA